MAIFVVQEHHAKHLHWDFRLEKDGVLKSWAVPKGISCDPKDKRLAIQVEDHSLDYAGFEGVIEDGQYGAGAVKIWDKGTYKMIEETKDKLEFELSGKRLKGTWVLIRFKGQDKNWLLIKKNNFYILNADGQDLFKQQLEHNGDFALQTFLP